MSIIAHDIYGQLVMYELRPSYVVIVLAMSIGYNHSLYGFIEYISGILQHSKLQFISKLTH